MQTPEKENPREAHLLALPSSSLARGLSDAALYSGWRRREEDGGQLPSVAAHHGSNSPLILSKALLAGHGKALGGPDFPCPPASAPS